MATKTPPIQIRLSDDRKSLTVWTTEEKPALDVDQVRHLIRALAAMRREMAPEPPAKPPPDRQITGIPEPTVHLTHDPERGDGGVLLIRDLGLDWLSYRLSAKALNALVARVNQIIGRGATRH